MTPLRGASDVTFLQDSAKGDEEVEIQVSKMHVMHIKDSNNAYDR